MAHMDCVKGSVLVWMRAAQSQVDKQLHQQQDGILTVRGRQKEKTPQISGCGVCDVGAQNL